MTMIKIKIVLKLTCAYCEILSWILMIRPWGWKLGHSIIIKKNSKNTRGGI